jgi:hypothetical protein
MRFDAKPVSDPETKRDATALESEHGAARFR